jgi:hypothetical protein
VLAFYLMVTLICMLHVNLSMLNWLGTRMSTLHFEWQFKTNDNKVFHILVILSTYDLRSRNDYPRWDDPHHRETIT